MSARYLRVLVVASAVAVMSGCVVVPAQPYYAGELVTVAPPPAQVEYVGPPPAVGYVWLGGYWAWRAGRHVWVAGHWEAGRPGYHWVAPSWHPEGRGWRFHQGHWAR